MEWRPEKRPNESRGDTEVTDDRVAALEKDVLRLDVSMNHIA